MAKSLACIAAVLALLLAAAVNAAEPPIKIGFVNPFRIENESVQAKQAIEELKKEFAARERQIQDAEKQVKELREEFDRTSKTMSDADRQLKQKEFNARAQRAEQMKVAIGEDFEQRRREALGKVIADANAVIKQIAEAQKFDLILQESVYFGPQIDITDQVLKAMAKQSTGK